MRPSCLPVPVSDDFVTGSDIIAVLQKRPCNKNNTPQAKNHPSHWRPTGEKPSAGYAQSGPVYDASQNSEGKAIALLTDKPGILPPTTPLFKSFSCQNIKTLFLASGYPTTFLSRAFLSFLALRCALCSSSNADRLTESHGRITWN